jgi:hypothetical protein
MFLQQNCFRFDNLLSLRRPARNQSFRRLSGLPAFALFLGMALLASAPAHAQQKTKVQIEPAKPKAMIYTTSIGIAADRYDAKAYDPATVRLMQDAGITLLRLPGNNGIDSLYHWSTGKIVNPYTNDRVPNFPPDRQFPAVVPAIDRLGSALVSVNYGTNADGTGGGEPAEAAAWVAYANGSTSSTQPLGKDSKGNDWKTVGFWASLRAASPLPTDDGFNHLRIGHPDPIGIQLWTIGNEPYSNGFYGQDHTVGNDADFAGLYGQSNPYEADLHAGQVPTAKDWGRHNGNKLVSPQAYGAAVVQYIDAMKAVDPAIMVGAFLVAPPISTDPHPFGAGWNAGVLKAACAKMDFAAVTFWESQGAAPNWVDWIDEDDLLMHGRYMGDPNNHYPHSNALARDYEVLTGDLADKYKKFCPAGHSPQLAVTNYGVSLWLPAKNPSAIGMFAADSIATLLESGAYTVVWSPIHGPAKATSPSFLDENNKLQPGYYGIQMLHEIAEPGDTFITASSEMESLTVHAVKRRDGGLGLLLINKDLGRSTTVTITVPGYSYATKGTRFDWGKAEVDAGKGITRTTIDNLGATFTVEVPRYGMTGIVIPKS